jgi:hypothetical protein
MNVGSITPDNITTASADVYVVNGQSSTVGPAAAAIQEFVSNGGGLVIGAQAWYWSYSNPLPQHPSNLALNKMGIVVSSTIIYTNYTFTGSPPTQIGNADVALGCIRDSCTGVTSSTCYISDEDQLTSAMQNLNNAAGFAPLDATLWATLQQVGALWLLSVRTAQRKAQIILV